MLSKPLLPTDPTPQHYLCERHGMWLVERELDTGNWLLALEPDQSPWTVAAETPVCLFCGRDLRLVEDLAAFVVRCSSSNAFRN